MKKVVLITGASSGIGLATLKKLIKQGHIVYGSARKKENFDVIEEAGGKPLMLEMTDYETLEAGVKKMIDEQGKIDALFNNAGYGLYGSVEDTSMKDVHHQFEVNLFSLAKMTKLVLPYMRKQKSGTIINTSSMGGRVYTPLGAWYHATKHALEGWSDCLRLELKQFNINVVVIEPGGIETHWGIVAADNVERISSQGAYKELGKKVASGMRNMYEKPGLLSPPSVIADVVAKAVNSKKPKTRYVAGKFAKLAMFVRKYFGDRIFDKIIMSQYK